MRPGLRICAALLAILIAAACVIASASEDVPEPIRGLEALGS